MASKNEKDAAGNRQSDYAGTNPDRYNDPVPADKQENKIEDQEAQNVSDSKGRIEGADAEKDRNKANEGKNERD
jgi:hypothetical protein